MIGLDTNILVHYFLLDDLEQSRKSSDILAKLTVDELGWISLTTILELVWELMRKRKVGRSKTAEVLDQLLSKKEIVIENAEVVYSALAQFRTGKADFADCLIAASARAAGCETILTFDRIAARDAGMQWAG